MGMRPKRVSPRELDVRDGTCARKEYNERGRAARSKCEKGDQVDKQPRRNYRPVEKKKREEEGEEQDVEGAEQER